MPREIIRVSMDQLPHCSSRDSSSGSLGGLIHHSTSINNLPSKSGPLAPIVTTNALASSSNSSSSSRPLARPARGPQRPSLSRRQRYTSQRKTPVLDPAFSQLATYIAKVQAQPHKPKRPSPLHCSVSPSTLEADELSDASGSEGESDSSPEVPEITDWREKIGLSPIVEEKGNMLGLELDGYSWTCEMQERMKEPKTPFPSPAILV